MNALLLDFGASHTKAGLFDGQAISGVQEFPSLKNSAIHPGHFELSLDDLKSQFDMICRQYLDKGRFDRIFVCSQMHGFLLLDDDDQPLSPYFGWQDERANAGQESTFSWLQTQMSDWFLSETGMKFRAGLPVVTFAHLLRVKAISQSAYRVMSIPEWLAFCFGKSNFVTHISLQMGMGFHQFSSGLVSEKILGCLSSLSSCELKFNRCVEPEIAAGYWTYLGSEIPIHIGGGDLQCALYGAKITENDVSINIGTGSQISRLNWRSSDPTMEYRPFFDGGFLAARTHIPAGRALNVYMGFLEDVVYQATGRRASLWSQLGQLTLSDITHSPVHVDLAVFQAANGFEHGGAISGILESQFELRSFLAGLLRSLLLQYLTFFPSFSSEASIGLGLQDSGFFSTLPDAELPRPKLLLSGGVTQRLPIIRDYFLDQLAGRVSNVEPNLQDTLYGLSLFCLRAMKG